MDLESLMKDAVLVGLAVGVIAMAAYIVIACGQYIFKPVIVVAAATGEAVPFGFQLT